MLNRIVFTLTLFALCLGVSTTVQARTSRDSAWPVTSFVAGKSVLTRYYQEFVGRQPTQSVTTQMHQFCDLLMGSDLLADRLSQLGGSPSDMRDILMELGSYEFNPKTKLGKEEKAHIRSLMLGLDMQLEIIEHSLATGTRGEFRREVLADIPPLNRVG